MYYGQLENRECERAKEGSVEPSETSLTGDVTAQLAGGILAIVIRFPPKHKGLSIEQKSSITQQGPRGI